MKKTNLFFRFPETVDGLNSGAQKKWVWSITLLFGLLYTLQTFLNHYYFRSYALDYGYYNQVFWDFAHFRGNRNTVFEPILESYFQVHPAFTLVVLAPLYWIFNWIFGTYTLLFIQNMFILAGGLGVFFFLRSFTKSAFIAFAGLLHYHVIWGHYSSIAFEYIDATVAASCVPLFLYFFHQKRYVIAALFFAFIIIARENMPLWFIFIAGVLMYMYRREKKRQWILGGIAFVALTYFVVLYKFIIPHFENENFPYWGFAYGALGDNVPEVLRFLVSHPWKAFTMLFVNHSGDPAFDGIKKEFYYVFLLSGGILLIYRPWLILWFIPIIAQKMWNDNYLRWGINIFYSIEVVSVLPIAALLVVAAMKRNSLRLALITLLLVSTAGITAIKMQNRVSKYYNADKENLLRAAFYKPDKDIQAVLKVIKSIPSGTNVCASQTLVPHLSYRDEISLFPYVRDAEMLILLLDWTNSYPLYQQECKQLTSRYISDSVWNVKMFDFPVVVLERFQGGKRKTLLRKPDQTIICGVDSSEATHPYLISDCGKFECGGKTMIDTLARTGTKSLRCDAQSRGGFTLRIDASKLKYGQEITARVWRKGAGMMAITDMENPSGLHLYTEYPSQTDSSGWELLELSLVVPYRLNTSTVFEIHTGATSDAPVWFDDFSVVIEEWVESD